MASTSIVLKSLSILLGLFFIFVGTLKLTPHLSKDLYKDLRNEYVKYAKVFPLSSLLDFKIPSKWYRRCVGILEITCGIAMAAIPNHKIKNTANITLLLLMFLGVYQHYMVSDPFERSGPALVFTFMLAGRLVVWYQHYNEDKILFTQSRKCSITVVEYHPGMQPTYTVYSRK